MLCLELTLDPAFGVMAPSPMCQWNESVTRHNAPGRDILGLRCALPAIYACAGVRLFEGNALRQHLACCCLHSQLQASCRQLATKMCRLSRVITDSSVQDVLVMLVVCVHVLPDCGLPCAALWPQDEFGHGDDITCPGLRSKGRAPCILRVVRRLLGQQAVCGRVKSLRVPQLCDVLLYSSL